MRPSSSLLPGVQAALCNNHCIRTQLRTPSVRSMATSVSSFGGKTFKYDQDEYDQYQNQLPMKEMAGDVRTEEIYMLSADSFRKILLNRPKALNALTLKMVREMTDMLTGIKMSKEAQYVWVEGKGKAFCAGGDVVSIFKAFHSKSSKAKELCATFFREEYQVGPRTDGAAFVVCVLRIVLVWVVVAVDDGVNIPLTCLLSVLSVLSVCLVCLVCLWSTV